MALCALTTDSRFGTNTSPVYVIVWDRNTQSRFCPKKPGVYGHPLGAGTLGGVPLYGYPIWWWQSSRTGTYVRMSQSTCTTTTTTGAVAPTSSTRNTETRCRVSVPIGPSVYVNDGAETRNRVSVPKSRACTGARWSGHPLGRVPLYGFPFDGGNPHVRGHAYACPCTCTTTTGCCCSYKQHPVTPKTRCRVSVPIGPKRGVAFRTNWPRRVRQ